MKNQMVETLLKLVADKTEITVNTMLGSKRTGVILAVFDSGDVLMENNLNEDRLTILNIVHIVSIDYNKDASDEIASQYKKKIRIEQLVIPPPVAAEVSVAREVTESQKAPKMIKKKSTQKTPGTVDTDLRSSSESSPDLRSEDRRSTRKSEKEKEKTPQPEEKPAEPQAK